MRSKEKILKLEGANEISTTPKPVELPKPPSPKQPSGKNSGFDLDSRNPEHLIFTANALRIEILGGIRLEGLDRMRATVKIQVQDSQRPAVRHNLDLYNDHQLEKLIRKVAEKQEVPIGQVEGDLNQLISTLETYRMEELQKMEDTSASEYVLSQKEKNEAVSFLKNENLMVRTLEALQESGIVGEAENALLLKMVMLSRKCADPLSAVCLARSGIGKSYLMEKVGMCVPGEDIREQTQFTDASFYHFARDEIKGKVFLIEDLTGALGVMYPIRELQSKKRISKTMTTKDSGGRLKTVTITVEGPVSIVACTTEEEIVQDNANRSVLIHLDGSREQDERIMQYQQMKKAGRVDNGKEVEIQQLLQNSERVLQQVEIINPYAEHITLPGEVLKPRRSLPLLLNLIEAITFYHQFQRKPIAGQIVKGSTYMETTPEDISWGFKLLRQVLFHKADEISEACRNFYEKLNKWCVENGTTHFEARELRKSIRLHPRTINRYLHDLTQFGVVNITGGNKYRGGYRYELLETQSLDQLEGAIDKHIESVLRKVATLHQKREKRRQKSSKSSNSLGDRKVKQET